MLIKLPEIGSFDDREGKPININLHIGRRSVMAFGNSDGDLQMLQWTAASGGSRFCLIVHHTDAEREWAYDRQSHIGNLDKAHDEASSRGWTIVDMKKDWKVIFRRGREAEHGNDPRKLPVSFQIGGRYFAESPDGGPERGRAPQ